MSLYWIPPTDKTCRFPPVEDALQEPNGLLAAGGDLSPTRLINAYRSGIFPWYNAGEPILWWSPSPRTVIFPAHLKVSRSLRRTLRRGAFHVTLDTQFRQVMEACAAPRRDAQVPWAAAPGILPPATLVHPCTSQDAQERPPRKPEGRFRHPASGDTCPSVDGGGTWISAEIIDAYCRLHEMGVAHSVEVWQEHDLVGGVYGLALGRVFFGESMFSRVTDASKVALVHLVRQLERWGYTVIDGQVSSPHLYTLGAEDISRAAFITLLQEASDAAEPLGPPGPWQLDADLKP